MSDKKNEFGYRTDRGWRIDDRYDFQIVSHSAADLAKVRDDYMGAFKPGDPASTTHPSGLGTVASANGQQARTGLIVKIAATHAGLVTRNNGFYMPDKMRAGVSTWTDHYPKPIQLHHNDSPGDSHDPVGRVVAARYVDTSGPVVDRFQNSVLRDQYNNQVGHADKKFWDRFISDRTSFIDKLQMLKVMDSVLNDAHYQGVGYIELTANITDPEAIQKILDGRYVTGSVGAVSDKAVCSVCNTDWLEEEHCGHRPGRIYDGKKCIVVTGNLEYDEYSFVNVPADRHSSVLGVEQIKNSVHDSADRSVRYFPVFSASKEDSTMSDKKTETIKDSTVVTPESTETTTDVVVEAPVVDGQVPATVQDQTEATPSVDDQVTTLMDKLLKDGLSDEEHEALYQLQLAEMDQGIVQDAKLTTEKRKKLASSTFCGPNKSFPVPDCAHVTAARRLIGRYKGEGSKDSILACVARKAKALGCDAQKDSVKDSVQDAAPSAVAGNPVPVDVPDPKAVKAAQLLELLLAAFGDGQEVNNDYSLSGSDKEKLVALVRKLVAFSKDSLQEVLVAEKLVDPSIAEDRASLATEVAKSEEIIGELRDQLAVLRKELKAAYEDVITVEDQLIASREAVRSVKTEKVSLLHMLDGSFTDQVKSNVLSLTDEALDSTIATLSAKVDISKIADKLNSGLSRTPDETVEVPAGLTEPTAVTQPTNKPTYATQQMVDEVYRRTLLSQGHAAAQAFYTDAVKRGFAKLRE
jgi:hypothetical protein